MFGSIGEWMYQSLAGINPAAAGFNKILIKPQPAGDLTWVNSSYQSVNGKIVSNWKREGDTFTLQLSIPANTTAEVCLPSSPQSVITESDHPADTAAGIKQTGYTNGFSSFEVGSGDYTFKVIK